MVFEVNGRKVVQGAMSALAIIEGFDVIEDPPDRPLVILEPRDLGTAEKAAESVMQGFQFFELIPMC